MRRSIYKKKHTHNCLEQLVSAWVMFKCVCGWVTPEVELQASNRFPQVFTLDDPGDFFPGMVVGNVFYPEIKIEIKENPGNDPGENSGESMALEFHLRFKYVPSQQNYARHHNCFEL